MLYLAGLASALYWPGISGAATSPRWAVLAAIPWVLKWQRATMAHWIGAAFVLWAALTMAWNPAPLDGINALFYLLIGAACFCLGDQLLDLKPVWIGAAVGIGLSSAAAIAQAFGFRGIAGLQPIHGLFVNENYMSEAAALVLVAVVAEQMWLLLPAVLPALLLGQGRGALIAVAAPFVLKYRRDFAWLLPIVLGAAVVVSVVTLIKAQPGSTPERLLIWQGALHGVNVFGHGIGSFWTQFPAFDLRQHAASLPETAHNEFLTAAFETGIVGLGLLAVLAVGLAIGPMTTPRMVFIAVLVEACFAFPFHLPTTTFLGLVAAGGAVWDSYLVRRFADDCRKLGRLVRAIAGRPVLAGAAAGGTPDAIRPSLPGIPDFEGAQ